jgi:predicted transcriptional regulator
MELFPVTVGGKVTLATKTSLQTLAQRQGTTPGALIRTAVEDFLARNEQSTPTPYVRSLKARRA